MAGQKKNQLTRYGAISKDIPFVTGKAFFLLNATEFALSDFNSRYPVDEEGVPRVYTSWASVIAAVALNTDMDVIFVSPLFTTAPTQAQLNQLNSLQCSVIQAAQLTPEGSYVTANLTPVSQASTTTQALFQVNGRIKLYGLFGQVITTLGSTIVSGQTTQLQVIPTIGSTTNLCTPATTGSATVGTQLAVNGAALNNILIVTTQGAFIAASQGTPITIQAGKIVALTGQTTTGAVAWTIVYAPIDPGAFVIPLQ